MPEMISFQKSKIRSFPFEFLVPNIQCRHEFSICNLDSNLSSHDSAQSYAFVLPQHSKFCSRPLTPKFTRRGLTGGPESLDRAVGRGPPRISRGNLKRRPGLNWTRRPNEHYDFAISAGQPVRAGKTVTVQVASARTTSASCPLRNDQNFCVIEIGICVICVMNF